MLTFPGIQIVTLAGYLAEVGDLNAEFIAIHRYYTKRNDNPLKKKQSIVALCGKLIRVLYTLGTKRIRYQATDVLGPVRQS